MKSIIRKISAAAMTLGLLGAMLSPTVQGLRYYSDSTDDFMELSALVTDAEEGSPDNTVILRTDGRKPDFRTLDTTYTVQGPDDTYVALFDSAQEAEEAMAQLNDTAGVLYAEPNGMVYAQAGERTMPKQSWGIDFMHTEDFAKELRQQELTPVTVGVVDSGITADHEIFQGRKIDGYSYIGNQYTQDNYNHGTSVAGVIADVTADLPVDILAVKVLDDTGSGTMLNASNGIRYAAEQGAKVINISFVSKSCSQYLHEAIAYAISLDSLPVISAGNYRYDMDKTPCCPSHLESPMVVAGCDAEGYAYKNTCYGSMIDLAAPGMAVRCAINDGGYELRNGTSFSAPHVSAVAAMLCLQNPEAGYEQLTASLLSHAKDFGDPGHDIFFGWGVPDFRPDDVRVVDAKIESLPKKTTYRYKEALDTRGLSMLVTFANGEQVIRTEGITVECEKLRPGKHTVTVGYEGLTDTYEVNVRLAWWQWPIWVLLFGWVWY